MLLAELRTADAQCPISKRGVEGGTNRRDWFPNWGLHNYYILYVGWHYM